MFGSVGRENVLFIFRSDNGRLSIDGHMERKPAIDNHCNYRHPMTANTTGVCAIGKLCFLGTQSMRPGVALKQRNKRIRDGVGGQKAEKVIKMQISCEKRSNWREAGKGFSRECAP